MSNVSMVDGHIDNDLDNQKMTDDEIIGYLGDIVTIYAKDATTIYGKSVVALLGDALDLINRQKAEIERLQEENKKQKAILEAINDEINPLPFETDFDKAIKTAKSEAIKEFAERLTDIICNKSDESLDNPDGSNYFIPDVLDDIDNLVKELTE